MGNTSYYMAPAIDEVNETINFKQSYSSKIHESYKNSYHADSI